MSDDDKNSASNANWGPSLPNGTNATHNVALSPFFIGSNGYAATDSNFTIISRGQRGRLRSRVVQTVDIAYLLAFGRNEVFPSFVNNLLYGYHLRCLVSTNNRLMNKEEVSLVSDVITADGETNMGISLPLAANATHNSALSPFFLNRSGMLQDILIVSRGTEYNSWSVSSYDPTFAGRFVAGGNVRPSYALYRRYGMSLRCLVSTNNG